MTNPEDDLWPEYDMAGLLKNAVPNKYAAAYAQGMNVVLLDSDVAKAFPDSESVNVALRLVIQLRAVPARQRRRPANRSG